MPTTTADIQDFLAQRRIAMVGVSRNPKDFSRMLFRDLAARGYDMIPVNPVASEMENRPCLSSVRDIHPAPDAALLMTSSSGTAQVVRECAEAGIHRIWMYRAGGQGAVNKQAVQFCHEKGMHLVEGHCPYMFLPRTPFFHRIHGLIMKLVGTYPKRAECGKPAA